MAVKEGVYSWITKMLPANVIRVLDKNTIVINQGRENGVKEGQRFLVYNIGPQSIVDAITKRHLGQMEIVKFVGVAIEVNDTESTLVRSDLTNNKMTASKAPYYLSRRSVAKLSKSKNARRTAQVGDLVKPV